MSTPPEDLSSDREDKFHEVEKEVEERTADLDEDFLGKAGERIDIPERRSKRVLKRSDLS